MTPDFEISRHAVLRRHTFWSVSDLGVVQRPHGYDQDLLATILAKALSLESEYARKMHLNLKYIRAAHELIPEINELLESEERLNALSESAGVALENYPVSVIGSTITFMGADKKMGSIDWHSDGVPVTEIVPLAISSDMDGGELEIYRGDFDEGLAILKNGGVFSDNELMKVPHRLGSSTLAQLIRVLHRTAPIHTGSRISLNLNMRSRGRPYVDDNSLVYLGADNPDF